MFSFLRTNQETGESSVSKVIISSWAGGRAVMQMCNNVPSKLHTVGSDDVAPRALSEFESVNEKLGR